MRYEEHRYRTSARVGASNFGRWISTRPFESWAFFIAGFVIARIIF
jgi:hypothetical protein